MKAGTRILASTMSCAGVLFALLVPLNVSAEETPDVPLFKQRARAPETAFRVGLMFDDNGGLLLGLDIGLPGMSMGAGWTGRLDFDLWMIDRDRGRDDDTGFAVMLNQITSSDGRTYFGGGLGLAKTDDDTDLAAKLLFGTLLSPRFALEFNLYFAGDAQLAVLGRFRF